MATQSAAEWTPSVIAEQRLAKQFLATTSIASPTDVVRRLGAVQSQDYAGGKWALAMRTRRVTSDSRVEDELNDGSILRTHVLRPTWHFVAGEDIRWMLALTGPRVKRAMAYHDRVAEIHGTLIRRSHNAISRALRDRNYLTRTELAQVLRRARIDASGQRLAGLMMHAELDAIICSGPRRGKQFTYALLDERAAPTKEIDRDEALLALTERYFATRGPATTSDFAWWSGLTTRDASKGIQIAGPTLERVTAGDKVYWLVPSSLRSGSGSATAHLLPNYDEFFIGFKDRSAIAQRLKSAALVTGGNALIGNVIVVNGQLAGSWKRAPSKGEATVELRLLTNLTRAERHAVDTAAGRFGEFLESPVGITVLEK